MYIDYAKSIYKELIANEFRLFSNDINFELSDNTISIPLAKNIGNILYVVFITNIDKVSLEQLNIEMQLYKRLFLDSKDTFFCDTIIFLSLNLTNDIETASEKITVNEFVTGLDFYNINWIIDMSCAKLIIPDGETDKLLRFNSIIETVLSNISAASDVVPLEHDNLTSTDSETNLHNLQNEIRQETSLKQKSNNLFLTFGIILTNFIVLMLMELLMGRGSSQVEQVLILFGANNYWLIANNHEFYRLITSVFLHVGFLHFSVNSLSLYIYGSRVEKYYGKSGFIIIYALSGIVASGASVLFTRITSAGASGAIFGLLGSLLALTKKTRKTVDGLNLYVICMLTISSIGFGFITPGVDNIAHLAGLIAGFVIGIFLI